MEESTKKHPIIAFIGAGHMASYIIKGLVSAGFPSDHIIATRRSEKALALLGEACGVRTTTNNHEAIDLADIVILGVKPFGIKALLENITSSLQSKKPLVVSIAAGIKTGDILSQAGGNLSVIRVMPNLPVSINSGVSCLFAHEMATEAHKNLLDRIFSLTGTVCWLKNETHMDISTVLAGSGPALFYRFLESLISGTIAFGIEPELATKMAMNTGIGALKLLQQSGQSPELLRSHVTSPGGTTAAALNLMEKQALPETVEKALAAGVKRAEELAEIH